MDQLVNLLNLARAMKNAEPVAPAFEWLEDSFHSMSINGKVVSLEQVALTYTLMLKEATALVAELSFTTPAERLALWDEIKRREDRSNSTHGFTAFTNKGRSTLQKIAQNYLIG